MWGVGVYSYENCSVRQIVGENLAFPKNDGLVKAAKRALKILIFFTPQKMVELYI